MLDGAHGAIAWQVDTLGGGQPPPPHPKTDAEKFAELCTRVLEAVRDNGGCSGRHVDGLVTGRTAAKRAALEHLVTTKKVERIGEGTATTYRVAPTGGHS
jgi:hypothetical protein